MADRLDTLTDRCDDLVDDIGVLDGSYAWRWQWTWSTAGAARTW